VDCDGGWPDAIVWETDEAKCYMNFDILDLIVRIHLGYVLLTFGICCLYGVLNNQIRNEYAKSFADLVVNLHKKIWGFVIWPWSSERFIRSNWIITLGCMGVLFITLAILSFIGSLW
jgi:hypothetical protein